MLPLRSSYHSVLERFSRRSPAWLIIQRTVQVYWLPLDHRGLAWQGPHMYIPTAMIEKQTHVCCLGRKSSCYTHLGTSGPQKSTLEWTHRKCKEQPGNGSCRILVGIIPGSLTQPGAQQDGVRQDLAPAASQDYAASKSSSGLLDVMTEPPRELQMVHVLNKAGERTSTEMNSA